MRGYHVYKDIWATVVGEESEDGNRADPFAVAVVRGEAIIGHVLKKISVCALYLRRGFHGLLYLKCTYISTNKCL